MAVTVVKQRHTVAQNHPDRDVSNDLSSLCLLGVVSSDVSSHRAE